MSDLDLRDLAAFLAVARTRNFRRAAVETHVSVSSLSQRLRDMEERLGVRLLHRTTRSVALTEAGELLQRKIAPAMGDVHAALQQIRDFGDVPSGRLRINGPAPAIDIVVAPMVTPFLQQYPQVELEIVAETSLIDIVAKGFDAGIRYGEDLAQDMIAVSLGPPQRFVMVASSQYIAQHGRPIAPQQLLQHCCIRTRFDNGSIPEWEFEKDGQVVRIPPRGPLLASYSRLGLEAARDGLGFYAVFEGYVRDDLATGRLVSVLEDWLPPFPGPFLYYPSRRQPPPALAAFVSFVAEWRKRERRAAAPENPSGSERQGNR
jgi:DNA-binding transcriptional LysR family regulator